MASGPSTGISFAATPAAYASARPVGPKLSDEQWAILNPSGCAKGFPRRELSIFELTHKWKGKRFTIKGTESGTAFAANKKPARYIPGCPVDFWNCLYATKPRGPFKPLLPSERDFESCPSYKSLKLVCGVAIKRGEFCKLADSAVAKLLIRCLCAGFVGLSACDCVALAITFISWYCYMVAEGATIELKTGYVELFPSSRKNQLMITGSRGINQYQAHILCVIARLSCALETAPRECRNQLVELLHLIGQVFVMFGKPGEKSVYGTNANLGQVSMLVSRADQKYRSDNGLPEDPELGVMDMLGDKTVWECERMKMIDLKELPSVDPSCGIATTKSMLLAELESLKGTVHCDECKKTNEGICRKLGTDEIKCKDCLDPKVPDQKVALELFEIIKPKLTQRLESTAMATHLSERHSGLHDTVSYWQWEVPKGVVEQHRLDLAGVIGQIKITVVSKQGSHLLYVYSMHNGSLSEMPTSRVIQAAKQRFSARFLGAVNRSFQPITMTPSAYPTVP